MVKQIFFVITALLNAAAGGLIAQTIQSSASIQQQEALADSQKSAATNPTYVTPLQAFQALYASIQANSSKATLACLTPNCIATMFGTPAPSSDADYAKLDAGTNQQQQNYTLLSLVFTPDKKAPQIAASYKYTRTVNGQTGPSVDHVTLTFIDTNTGWKIDDWEN